MKKKFAQGERGLVHFPTREMIANSLTMPIVIEVYGRHMWALGLCKL